MAHWTEVLADLSVVEFVLLGALTTQRWLRRGTRGAGWAALAFAILGFVALTVRLDHSVVAQQEATKLLAALFLLVPYCLFRFAGSFRRLDRLPRALAAASTIATVTLTLVLPVGAATYWRLAVGVQFGFLFGSVVVHLLSAAENEPAIAAARMRLVAAAVTSLGIGSSFVALGLHGPGMALVSHFLFACTGLLFLIGLVAPSLLRLCVRRREHEAFPLAMSELVAARDANDVAARLVPHVRTLMGASSAALLTSNGTIVASQLATPDSASVNRWDEMASQHSVSVRTHCGPTHRLAVTISPSMSHFGSEELRDLKQLASLAGIAIDRCQMTEQMAFDASHDALTGLANRNHFMERLAEALHEAERCGRLLSVLFIDLDQFKLVNDRADHSAGDAVLKEMAQRLSCTVDVLARFGGDEFVACTEVQSEEAALEMAERIRTRLREPLVVKNGPCVVTASIGLVVNTRIGTTPDVLLRDADHAMYDAKRAGRDVVVLHRAEARERAELRWGLTHTAVARGDAG